jgi:hypothetical protein
LTAKIAEEVKIFWLNPKRKEDEGRNLYNLYNAITDYLTHVVEAERYEYATRTNTDCLLALSNLAKNRQRFKEWVKPLPVPEVKVEATPAPAAPEASNI